MTVELLRWLAVVALTFWVSVQAAKADAPRVIYFEQPEPQQVEGWEASTDGATWRPLACAAPLGGGLFWGVVELPPGVVSLTLRAVSGTAVSDASNAVVVPNCHDADLSGDGVVGGPDWGLFAVHFGRVCGG